MAEALRDAGGGANLTRATFLEFHSKYEDIERELAEVAETRRSLNRRRKDLRKSMGAAGISVDMFDRMLDDLELIPEEREANTRDLAQYMAWMAAPPGWQASMDFQSDDPGERAYNVHELHAIDGEGFDAGQGGRRADSNPYRSGTEAFQRWHNAWNRGQQVAVETQMGGGAPNGSANGHDPEPPAAGPKRRSRKAAAPPPEEPYLDEGPTVLRVEDMPDHSDPAPENPSPEPEPPAGRLGRA